LSAYQGGGAASDGGAGDAADAPPPDDTLTLLVNGQQLQGWQGVRVTADCERVPRSFDIIYTDRYPGQEKLVVKPGDTCQVKLGADLVLTGYVDRFIPAVTKDQHIMRVQGRGKCEDLVDCSAVVHGMQVGGASLLTLAQAMAAPYDIVVTGSDGTSVQIPQFNVTLGETPMEIIELVARYSTMLAYEDENGTLILAAVGATTMASGFQEGVNVQTAEATFSMDGRYSDYLPAIMSVDSLHDLGSGNTPFPVVKDNGVPRFRQLVVVSEQFQYGQSIAQARAQWEMSRRYGRSQVVRLVVDSWRDSSGELWRPNAVVPLLDIPSVYVNGNGWIIANVTFIRDPDRGTVAEMEIMPKEAFTPEPSILQLYDWQIGQGLDNPGGAASDTPNYEPRAPGLD
jgi:prophage tail gpP-like protein